MNTTSKRILSLVAALAILVTIARLVLPWAKSYFRQGLQNVVAEAATQALRKSSRDMRLSINRRAADESADFLAKNMGMAVPYADKLALLDASISRVDRGLNGAYCEFGVYTGGTINHIASRVDGLVHGFDSFEGLPADWRPGFAAGAFAVKNLPGVRQNVRLYKGWFKDSLPVFIKSHPEALAFGHLDADLYASTKDVFDALGDHIVAGTVLQFDEFFNYPDWQDGESKAFFEFCKSRSAEFEYIGYVPNDEQVAVRIKRIPPNRP
jgi:hypothetical protein